MWIGTINGSLNTEKVDNFTSIPIANVILILCALCKRRRLSRLKTNFFIT